MDDACKDGRRQVAAAISLLDSSGLVRWDGKRPVDPFSAADEPSFELFCKGVDPVCGRLICWIHFSTGAEFLAKGVCLLNKIDVRDGQQKEVPAYPPVGTDLNAWAKSLLVSGATTAKVTFFGTLNRLVKDAGDGKLQDLCGKPLSEQDCDLVRAAFLLLKQSIRNRDAHAFVPYQRQNHFWLVSELFVKSFNILARLIPGGATEVEDWREQIQSNGDVDD